MRVACQFDAARASLVKGDAHKALYIYEQITKDFPEFPEAWRRQGEVRIRALQKRDDTSLKLLEEARRLNPRNYVILLDLAHLYESMGRPPDALYQEAKALNPLLSEDNENQ